MKKYLFSIVTRLKMDETGPLNNSHMFQDVRNNDFLITVTRFIE